MVEYIAARCAWLVEAAAGKGSGILARLISSKLVELVTLLKSRASEAGT